MKSKLGDHARLCHIRDAAIEILQFTQNRSLEEFLENAMLKMACVKELEIIGEAANQVSNTTKEEHPEIEWRLITAMRNVLVHEYFAVSYERVWETIISELPDLLSKIEAIIEKEE
jgi:uncharacterized protein with HEPN domain